MNKIILSCSLSLFILNTVSAQKYSYKKDSISIKKVGTVNLSEIKDEWIPLLQNLEMPQPGGEHENKELEKIKKQLRIRYPQKNAGYKTTKNKSITTLGGAPSPIVQSNFEGNILGAGTPLDNDMAISNGGKLVSVINTYIYVFDVNNLSFPPWKKSLESFAILGTGVPVNNPLNNNNAKFDPKVIYDPEADKFIMVMLNGFNPTYSKIIVAFSQTNDPTQGWNIYVVPGNPLNNSMWTDYPQIALTQEDFFITINLLTDSLQGGPKPWELAFRNNVIWQINKEDGYTGVPIISPFYYHDIAYNEKKLQYICPMKSGDEQLESNMYLVSNKSFSIGTDTIFLVEITNSLNSGNSSVNLIVGKSDIQYYVPPNVSSSKNSDFKTNINYLGAI